MSEIDHLDRIDRNILAALGRDGRMSMNELAEKVGLSKTPVQARVRRLEKDGIIRGYSAVVDRERIGEGHVAFVQVKLSDTRSAALDAFNKAVNAVAEIEQCHMMAASFDYLLKVRTRDIGSYRRVLGERISALPHVAQTSTFVAMETVKDR
jgi:Lrp/AsnC family leucine-responsive transcriptional regulator